MGIFDSFRRWRAARRARAPIARNDDSHRPATEAPAQTRNAQATATTKRPIAQQPTVEPNYRGPERRNKQRNNARSGTRILIVDDSATIVALLRKMLQQNNYVTIEAYTAEDALQILQREPIDLIFLDIVLPAMDGFAALRTLRREPATRLIPVIMISGNTQATEQFYVQRIGADDFMKKPFSRAEVFARIEHLVDAEGVPRRASPRSTATTSAN